MSDQPIGQGELQPSPAQPQSPVQPQAPMQAQPVQPQAPAQPVQQATQPAAQPFQPQQPQASGAFGQPQPAQSAPAGYGQQPPYQAQPVYANAAAVEGTEKTLRMVAFVFCLLSTIGVGWLLIPLAWMIPMTVHCWGLYKGTKANTVAFGVCTLIFCSLIAGILLLVSKKDPKYV